MKELPIILFAGDHGWKLARGESLVALPSSDSGIPKQIAEAIAAMIGSTTVNVTLALPASWCLSSTVSLAGIPARNRRTALLYRLELLLPLAAEDIAADYIYDEPDSALAICVSAPTVKPIVDALETAGVIIDSIVATSVYAAISLLRANPSQACDLLVWQTLESVEIFNIRGGRIAGWYIAPSSVDDVGWYLKQLPSTEVAKSKVTVCNLQPDILGYLKTLPQLEITSVYQQPTEAAVMSATRTGFASPIELRRDGLAPSDNLRVIRKPVIEFVAATLFMLLCICGAAFWRSMRLETLAANDRLQQQELFRQAFPGHAIPPNIVSRLRSEQRSLTTGGVGEGTASTLQSALPTLQSILSGIEVLPADARLQIDDLKADDGQFALDGVLRNRNDMTALVDSLGQNAKLKLDPPQTEQFSGQGLHVILTGTLVKEPTPK